LGGVAGVLVCWLGLNLSAMLGYALSRWLGVAAV